MKTRPLPKQSRGQSMVEYLVILMALVPVFLPWKGGPLDQLRQAVVDKHRGYTYAASLSEIPETDRLDELADYYDALGKYPELAAQLRSGGQKIGNLSQQIESVNDRLQSFDPGDIASPLPHFEFKPSPPLF